MIDGRPIRESTFSGVDLAVLQSFPIDIIKRIEVVRGPGSVLYGTGAYSGVINIITKDFGPAGQKIRVSGGGYGEAQVNATGGVKEFGASVRGFHTRGFEYNAYDETPAALGGPTLTSDRFRSREYGGLFKSQIGGVSVRGFIGDVKQDMLGSLSWNPKGDINSTRKFLDLGYSHQPVSILTSSYNLTYNKNDTDFVLDVGIPEIINTEDLLFETTQTLRPFEALEFIIGGTAQNNRGKTPVLPEQREFWYSLYLQSKLRLGTTTLLAGVQGNKVPDIEFNIVPRIGVIQKLSERWTLKLLNATAFRAPTIAERYIQAVPQLQGNPNLIHETVNTTDLQANYVHEGYRAALTYFHSDYKNLIQNSPNASNINSYGNTGRRLVDGIEFENKWIPSNKVLVSFALSYIYSRQSDLKDDTRFPRMSGKLGGSYTFDAGITLGLFDVWTGEPLRSIGDGRNTPVNDTHSVTLQSDFALDQLFGTNILQGASAQIFVDNLLNETIQHQDLSRHQVNAYPLTGGRNVIGQISYKF